MIRIPLRADRNIYHCRIRTDRSGPCDCQYIAVSFPVCSTDHHCRKRVQHIPRFPHLFGHLIFLLCLSADYCCKAPTRVGTSCFFLDTTPRSIISSVSSGRSYAFNIFSLASGPTHRSSDDSAKIFVSIKKIIFKPLSARAFSR